MHKKRKIPAKHSEKSKGSPSQEPVQTFSIDRLPLDLFIRIADYYARPKRRLHDIVRLTLVSKKWQRILEEAPGIWTTITAADTPALIAKAFQRSNGLPLDLHYAEYGAKTHYEAFFAMALERVDQWRSFRIKLRGSASNTTLDDLGVLAPPNLEVFHFDNGTGWGRTSVGSATPFAGSTGSLILKELVFASIPVTCKALEDVITKSRQLQVLRLIELDLSADQSLQGNLASEIDLPFLTDFGLEALEMPVTNYFLSKLSAPRLRKFKVDQDFGEREPSDLLANGMVRHIPALTSMISESTEFLVKIIRDGAYQIIIGGLDLVISTHEDVLEHLEATFHWISTNLGADLKKLPLDLQLFQCEEDQSYLQWFTNWATVTSLFLSYEVERNDPQTDFMNLLSLPMATDPPHWPLPHLEVFHTTFMWWDPSWEIVRMVKRRQVASSEQDPGAPKPFREIRLTVMKEFEGREDMAAVRQVMGGIQMFSADATLYWNGKIWEQGGAGLGDGSDEGSDYESDEDGSE